MTSSRVPFVRPARPMSGRCACKSLQVRLTLDRFIQPDGRRGIICSDVIELLEPIACRGPERANDQNDAFSELDELLSQAARWTALCRFTCSCEFHSASGPSASRTAISTPWRNQASCAAAW
jgi:hypothetical protein